MYRKSNIDFGKYGETLRIDNSKCSCT